VVYDGGSSSPSPHKTVEVGIEIFFMKMRIFELTGLDASACEGFPDLIGKSTTVVMWDLGVSDISGLE
jgi:hypothetical protein